MKKAILFRTVLLFSLQIFYGLCQLPAQDSSEPYYARLAEIARDRTRLNITYDPSYFSIDYPGGDIPPDKGVCTDLVIRTYRAAGTDLQKEVHMDMSENFDQYPSIWGLSAPDPNIDHRRVPNLMKFFERKGTVLVVSRNEADYKAGDLVTWDLGRGIPHIGIVAREKVAGTNRPMIIHNIGRGPETEDILFRYRITGHYRYMKKPD